jgi:hypothetical protein
MPKEEQLFLIRQFFSPETIDKVGVLVVGAILFGDKSMTGTVREAVKAGDHLFNRNRELALLRPAARYQLRNWFRILSENDGNIQHSVEELKKGIEQHCNGGKKLDQYRWTRLRRELRIPKRSCSPLKKNAQG